ncbi:MAG: hypothetical protein PSX81_10060 [bacterium]|nr:hypothetical protein [bacterium]
MKYLILLIIVFNLKLGQAQIAQKNNSGLSIEILSSLKSTKYYFKDFSTYEHKVYSKYYPLAYGLQLGFYTKKNQIGIKLSYIDFKKNLAGYDYTYYPLQPDPSIPKSVQFTFREQRTRIFPYYNFLKKSNYKICFGPSIDFINTNFNTSEKRIMTNGDVYPNNEFTSQFNKARIPAYGLQLELGVNMKSLILNFYSSYEISNEKYFKNQQLKNSSYLLIGFSAGYLFTSKIH